MASPAHAGVAVAARERAALERLCRYLSVRWPSPPQALERPAVLLTAEELVRRLVARIPGARRGT